MLTRGNLATTLLTILTAGASAHGAVLSMSSDASLRAEVVSARQSGSGTGILLSNTPADQSCTLTVAGETATTTGRISPDAFTMLASETRDGNLVSDTNCEAQISFSALPDAPGGPLYYSLTGNAAWDKPAELGASLEDETTRTNLFSAQFGLPGSNGNLAFGGGNGQPPGFTGSITGTLIPGRTYQLFLSYDMAAFISDDGATLNGAFTFTVSDTVPVPLPASVWFAALPAAVLLCIKRRTLALR